MQYHLFERFAPVIRSLSSAELNGAPSLNAKLRLAQDGKIEVCYAPFEFINPHAKIVIVGITPGRTQMLNSLKELRRQLDLGTDSVSALIAAKLTGAFSGSMRPNLIGLLDCVGLNRWMRMGSCVELFSSASNLVQTTSVLRNPVFVDGKNYKGTTPSITRHPLLQKQLLTHFAEDVRSLSEAIFIPLGDKVAEALYFVADQGCISRDNILDGLPHPSGANAERIAYFLGKKNRTSLSKKTDPDKLDKARDNIICKVMALV